MFATDLLHTSNRVTWQYHLAKGNKQFNSAAARRKGSGGAVLGYAAPASLLLVQESQRHPFLRQYDNLKINFALLSIVGLLFLAKYKYK